MRGVLLRRLLLARPIRREQGERVREALPAWQQRRVAGGRGLVARNERARAVRRVHRVERGGARSSRRTEERA